MCIEYKVYEELLKLVESIALISPQDKSTKGKILLNKKDKIVKLVLQIFTDISLNVLFITIINII